MPALLRQAKCKLFNKNKNGFTLVELLVVIAIIGILAALGFYSFTTAQKKARDVQRKNDLKELKQALEAYAGSNNGLYPSSSHSGGNLSCSRLHDGIFASTGPLASYLPDPSKIDDPKSSTTYSYAYFSFEDVGGGTKTKNAVFFDRLEGEPQSGAFLVVCTNGITKQIDPASGNDICGSSILTGRAVAVCRGGL